MWRRCPGWVNHPAGTSTVSAKWTPMREQTQNPLNSVD